MDMNKYEQLQKENDALKAYIERLREALQKVVSDSDVGIVPRSHLDHISELLYLSPQASLNHILSKVEEETIEQHVDQIRKKIDSVSSDTVKNALEYIAELFEVQPRKYKKQSDVENM